MHTRTPPVQANAAAAQLEDFSPPQLAMTVWGLAAQLPQQPQPPHALCPPRCFRPGPRVVGAIVCCAHRQLSEFRPPALAATVWGLAVLGVGPGAGPGEVLEAGAEAELLGAMSDAAWRRLDEFSAAELGSCSGCRAAKGERGCAGVASCVRANRRTETGGGLVGVP